jgi:hypothetical protein
MMKGFLEPAQERKNDYVKNKMLCRSNSAIFTRMFLLTVDVGRDVLARHRVERGPAETVGAECARLSVLDVEGLAAATGDGDPVLVGAGCAGVRDLRAQT